MEENRVQKHAEYRNRQNGAYKQTSEEMDQLTSTKTLPLEKVMEEAKSYDKEVNETIKALKKKYLTYSLLAIGLVILIFIIIIIAIVIFRR